MAKKSILIITPFLPYPLKSGGQIKIYNSLKSLSNEYDIILVSFIESPGQKQYILELKRLCKEVFTVLRRPSWHTLFNKISLPIFIKYFYSQEMKETISKCLVEYNLQLVQFEYANMAYYAQFISGLPKVLVEHDTSIYALTNSYEKPLFGRIFRFFDWLNWKRFQKNMYRYFDRIITFTEEDYKLVRRAANQSRISVIPIGLDLKSYNCFEEIDKKIDILFVGHMPHYPNLDGIKYFVKEIFPIIKNKIPDIKFSILGSGISKENFEIKSDGNIEVIGEVKDVKPYLARAKLMVAPIRLGGGIKVKILEAMAMGIPVVATKNAARGLKVEYNKDIYVADSPRDFADKVLVLLQDEYKRKAVGKSARDVIEINYSIERVAAKERAVYTSLFLDN